MSVKWSKAPQRVLNIAEALILKYHVDLMDANIAFIMREGEPPESGGKEILGSASKFPQKLLALVDQEYHFLIWLTEKALESGDEKLTAVIDHELCHCEYSIEGKTSILRHDIEEFNQIIERYGVYRIDLLETMKVFKQSAFFNAEITSRPKGMVGTVNVTNLDSIE